MTTQNITVHYKNKKEKKRTPKWHFLGQLNNIAIYKMDGNDKIIIFTGIIKL